MYGSYFWWSAVQHLGLNLTHFPLKCEGREFALNAVPSPETTLLTTWFKICFNPKKDFFVFSALGIISNGTTAAPGVFHPTRIGTHAV
jgi:hypothetical protein